jgi:hypothetical protein
MDAFIAFKNGLSHRKANLFHEENIIMVGVVRKLR